MAYHVFISYPRIADERGAVSDIRAHVERELQIKTGDKGLIVFQDRSSLVGGDSWRRLIADELNQTDVFLLLLSPLWLASDECRKELQLFMECSRSRGRAPVIIPLLWDETQPTDAGTQEQAEMLAWIQSHQAVHWEELRHQNSSYPGYFKAVSELAYAIKKKLRAD